MKIKMNYVLTLAAGNVAGSALWHSMLHAGAPPAEAILTAAVQNRSMGGMAFGPQLTFGSLATRYQESLIQTCRRKSALSSPVCEKFDQLRPHPTRV
jgi:hypothetical protein